MHRLKEIDSEILPIFYKLQKNQKEKFYVENHKQERIWWIKCSTKSNEKLTKPQESDQGQESIKLKKQNTWRDQDSSKWQIKLVIKHCIASKKDHQLVLKSPTIHLYWCKSYIISFE